MPIMAKLIIKSDLKKRYCENKVKNNPSIFLSTKLKSSQSLIPNIGTGSVTSQHLLTTGCDTPVGGGVLSFYIFFDRALGKVEMV